MPHYYCYLLDVDGKIKARETVQGTDDTEALRKAREYLAAHPLVPAIEIWLKNRTVGKLIHQSEASPSHFVGQVVRSAGNS